MANVLPACYMQMASISNIQYEVEGRKLFIRGIGFTFMLSIRRVVISGYRIRKYEYYYGRYLLELLELWYTMFYGFVVYYYAWTERLSVRYWVA